MTDYWYNALRARHAPGAMGTNDSPTGMVHPATAERRETPEDTEKAPTALAEALATLTDEMRRLSHENAALAAHVETLLQDHDTAHADRTRMLARLDHVCRLVAAQPDTTGQQLRRELTGELKPILLAIVNLLELSTGRAGAPEAEAAGPAGPGGAPRAATHTPAPPTLAPPTLAPEEHQALPAILTRPLEELLTPARTPPRRDAEQTAGPPRATGHATEPSSANGAFSWTSLFSGS